MTIATPPSRCAVMARLGSDDVGLNPAAAECEVAQNVACLVAHKLVRPAKRAADQPFVGEHQGGLEIGAERQPPGTEILNFMQEPKGSGTGKVALELLRVDVVGARLPSDEGVAPLDGGGKAE
jgi:hypothetical protein